MKRIIVSCLLVVSACEEHQAFEVGVARAALDVDFYPTLSDDLIEDGVCSLREAFRAISTRAPVDGCPAGRAGLDFNNLYLPAGTFSAALAGVDDDARAGDFDVAGNVRVFGASDGETSIDMNGLDRAFHVVSYFSLELYDLTIREGCANGGNCTTDATASIAAGGAIFFNSSGTLHVERTRIEASRARVGGGIALYNGSAQTLIEDSVIAGNTASAGGGGVDATVDWTLRDSTVEHNAATLLGATGGGVRQARGTALLDGATLARNTALGSGGGAAAVGNFQASAAGALHASGTRFEANVANVGGGNVFVNAGAGGSVLLNVPCAASGCSAVLTDSIVIDGVADEPLAPVFGSGGNLLANASGPAPGRIELRGTTLVAAGVDSSAPSAPDCFGPVELFDDVSVDDPSGCTLSDHRGPAPVPLPVCGNAIVEPGEQCDDGARDSQDGCSAQCRIEHCVLWAELPVEDAGVPDAGVVDAGLADAGRADAGFDAGACEPWTALVEPPADGRCVQVPAPDQGPFGLRVALTFDDGPNAQSTPPILAALRQRGIPATFFMVGARLLDEAGRALAREIHADPLFRIANHTYTHARMTELDLDTARQEIELTSEALRAAIGDPCYFPRYFRFPFNASNCEVMQLARERGFGVAGVNIDPLDWCYGGNGTCVAGGIPPEYHADMIGYALDRMQRAGGGIVLLHDAQAHTAALLPELLDRMSAAGATFVDLEDSSLFPALNAEIQPPEPPACCGGVVH